MRGLFQSYADTSIWADPQSAYDVGQLLQIICCYKHGSKHDVIKLRGSGIVHVLTMLHQLSKQMQPTSILHNMTIHHGEHDGEKSSRKLLSVVKTCFKDDISIL